MASYSLLRYLAAREKGNRNERRLLREKLLTDNTLHRWDFFADTMFKILQLLGKTCWPTMGASTQLSFQAKVASWPLAVTTGEISS